MKQRLLTFALAIGAFAAFYALLAPKPAPPQEKPTRPLSTEPGPNGYLALQRWLAAAQVRTLSLRERYGRLEETSAASPAGNLLITTAPHLYPIRNSEAAPLSAWIASGNTLLVMAGLSDTPDWSMGEDPNFMAHMTMMTGLRFEQVSAAGAAVKQSAAGNGSDETTGVNPQQAAGESANDAPGEVPEEARGESPDKAPAPGAHTDPAAQPDSRLTTREVVDAFRKLQQPEQFALVPTGSHPLLAGVASAKALSEYPTAQWRAVSESAPLLLELARNPESGVPVLWLLPWGEGQIIVSAYGSLFTNKLLGQQDNARLLANIVRWSVRPGAAVIIDDAHQGLVAFYDPAAFFGDARLHRSLWWLAGLWLVFVLGPQRLRAAVPGWNPVDITGFVRASGGFMARVLKPASAARELFANFFNEIRGRLGLPPADMQDSAPVWQWLEAHAALPARDFTRLQALHRQVLRGRRIDLPKLQNLLVQVRAALN